MRTFVSMSMGRERHSPEFRRPKLGAKEPGIRRSSAFEVGAANPRRALNLPFVLTLILAGTPPAAAIAGVRSATDIPTKKYTTCQSLVPESPHLSRKVVRVKASLDPTPVA